MSEPSENIIEAVPDYFSLTREALTNFQNFEEAEIPSWHWIEKVMKRGARRMRVAKLYEALYDITTNRATRLDPEFSQGPDPNSNSVIAKGLWQYKHEKDNITVTETEMIVSSPRLAGMIVTHKKQRDFHVNAPDQGYDLHVHSCPYHAIQVQEMRPLSTAEQRQHYSAAPEGSRVHVFGGFTYR